jgi:hypothetical protein
MTAKCIYFIKTSDFPDMDSYYKKCFKNVMLELYVRDMFAGNVERYNNCIWYGDDIDESFFIESEFYTDNHYHRIKEDYNYPNCRFLN